MDLYGLIHKRFITTKKGLALVRDKYVTGVYGKWPRFYWDRYNCLPVGTSSDLNNSRVKIYCPKWKDIYKIKYEIKFYIVLEHSQIPIFRLALMEHILEKSKSYEYNDIDFLICF